MKVGLQLCFKENFFEEDYYYKLFAKFVRFVPKTVFQGVEISDIKKVDPLKIVQNYSSNEYLAYTDSEDNIFMSAITGTNHPHRSIKMVQNSDVFLPGDMEIESIIDYNDFVSAYLFNEDFEFAQSTRYANALEDRKLAPEIIDSLKNTPLKEGVWSKEYDTTFNPGRSNLIEYTWLMVAWKMWFGEPFFNLVSKEKILSFPYAEKILELPKGHVYVQLYEDIERPYTAENIFRQRKWREWLDYDTLIENESK